MAGKSVYRVLIIDGGLGLSTSAGPLFGSGTLISSGPAARYEAALEAVREQSPDVALVDLATPAAFSAIEAIMAEAPIPILALHPRSSDRGDPFRALTLGALEVVERDDPPSAAHFEDLAKQIALLAQVRVVQHVQGKRRGRHGKGSLVAHSGSPVVTIAASLGGPKALGVVLSALPRAFPAPICVCQHISDGFTRGLSQWLGSQSALRVVEAKDGEPLVPGTVYVAQWGSHLTVTATGRVRLVQTPPRMGFRPSCDVLLESAAASFGANAIGVVLTGMGHDGAQGLAEIRLKGGRTIAQDEASSVVFGMPKEAIALGAAEQILPLGEIGPALARMVNR